VGIEHQKKYPWCAADLTPDIVRSVSRFQAENLRALGGTCERIVTKTPEDFWELGLIRILFPKARIVHCRRDPVDTCLSCFMQDFTWLTYATRLDLLAEVYRLYRHAMDHWRAVLPPSAVLEVSYEDVVDQTEVVARKLCNFIQVPFEESCLRFHENSRRVDTASRWQVRRSVYRSSVRRWERYREFLGPLLSLEETGKRSEEDGAVR
jgi:hypothetical protein